MAKDIKTLSDSHIVTKRSIGRRTFMGVVAAGSVGAVLAPTTATAADSDNGSWTDTGSCPRGYGTGYSDSDAGGSADAAGYGRSGVTDQDGGNIADLAGRGRGAPYC